MADVVSSHVICDGPRNYIVHLTNISDGTGESLVNKIDISTLKTDDGLAPTKTSVKEIQWSVQGMSSVRLYWDHNTDDTIVTLAAGNGYLEWGALGFLSDPQSAGGTGDILLTTAGQVSGATYDITLFVTMS
jgi:hypothetical protein